jgi:hypothetical protein
MEEPDGTPIIHDIRDKSEEYLRIQEILKNSIGVRTARYKDWSDQAREPVFPLDIPLDEPASYLKKAPTRISTVHMHRRQLPTREGRLNLSTTLISSFSTL